MLYTFRRGFMTAVSCDWNKPPKTPSCHVWTDCNSRLYAYTLILVGPRYNLKKSVSFGEVTWYGLIVIYVWKHRLLCAPALWETVRCCLLSPSIQKHTMKLFRFTNRSMKIWKAIVRAAYSAVMFSNFSVTVAASASFPFMTGLIENSKCSYLTFHLYILCPSQI